MKLNTRECRSQGNFPRACHNARKEWRKEGNRYPLKEGCFGVLYGWIRAAYLLVPGKNLQKPANKCLLEMLHNTKMLRKISCFYAEIFHIKSPSKNVIYMTYLRWLSNEKYDEIEQKIRLRKAWSLKGLWGKTPSWGYPNNPLRQTCKTQAICEVYK